MNDATDTKPKRGLFSIVILLGLVLAVTVQLVTGFILMAHVNRALLSTHIFVGALAIILTADEWVWLLATRAGRYRLSGFFAPGSGIAEWSEAAFLLAVTVTVVIGALLAASLHGGVHLPFGALLATHRALAIAVAVLYLLHSALAMRRRGKTKRA
jgi:hypothetical protein